MHRLTCNAGIFQRDLKKKKDHQQRSAASRGRPPACLSLVGFWALAASAPPERSEQLEWNSDSCQNKEQGFNGGEKRRLIESGGSSSCMGGHTRCARQQTRTVQVLLLEEMFFTAILLTMREATRRQPANIQTYKLGLQGLHLLTPSLILQPPSLVLNWGWKKLKKTKHLRVDLFADLPYVDWKKTAVTLKFGPPLHPTVNSNYLINGWWTKRTL